MRKIGNNILTILLVIVIVTVVLSICILAAVPPVSRDALTHHLAVPKLYIQHGGIYEIPSVDFCYYPMNIDLLYILPLYWGNDIAPNYIHFGFALLTAWFLFSYLKKKITTTYALFGALFFLTTPIIIRLSITAYVDLGLICFSSVAIFYLLRWIEYDFKFKFLFYSALSCGLALGTKYNALIVLCLLALLIPVMYIRSREDAGALQIKAIGFSGFFVLVSLTVFSPWMIRNYFWTHNPLYPLYNHLFNSKSNQLLGDEGNSNSEDGARLSSGSQHLWNHFQTRKIVFKESLIETLTIPIRIFFQGQDDDPKFFDGKLNPFLLIFPLLAFWPNPALSNSFQKREKYLLIAFPILYLLFVYLQIDMRIRWISPVIPPLVILSMFGLFNISKVTNRKDHSYSKKIVYYIMIFSAAISLCINLKYLQEQFNKVQPWDYITGKISRSDYISKYRPEYSVIEYANRTLRKGDKILALFLGNRIYYSDFPMDCRYDIIFRDLKKMATAEDLYRQLKRNDFTNLIIRFDLLQHWMNSVLTDNERKLLSSFFKLHLKNQYIKDGHGLFALVGGTEKQAQ